MDGERSPKPPQHPLTGLEEEGGLGHQHRAGIALGRHLLMQASAYAGILMWASLCRHLYAGIL